MYAFSERKGALSIGGALCLALGTAPVLAQCPDELAVPRPAVQHQILGGSPCGSQFRIYDWSYHPEPIICPRAVIDVPAHATCERRWGSNRECVFVRNVPVTSAPVECAHLTVSFGENFFLSLGYCRPGKPTVIGHIEDVTDAPCAL